MGNVSEEDFEEKKIKDEAERQSDIKATMKVETSINEQVNSINVERNEEIKKIITYKWKETSKEVKEEIKTLMADKGISKIGDVENNPTSVMEEILKKLN